MLASMTFTLLRGLAWDVGLPVATYYALHLLGVSDWVALLAPRWSRRPGCSGSRPGSARSTRSPR